LRTTLAFKLRLRASMEVKQPKTWLISLLSRDAVVLKPAVLKKNSDQMSDCCSNQDRLALASDSLNRCLNFV